MECPRCGRYAPPDPETGYDADDTCPTCAADDDPDADEPMDQAYIDERDIMMACDSLAQAIAQADTVDRALELAVMIDACVHRLEVMHLDALVRARTLNT